MYCENCGSKLRENAAFCPKCGTAVKSEDINKEVRQYTSLVPDFNDIDENKSMAERVSDIELLYSMMKVILMKSLKGIRKN